MLRSHLVSRPSRRASSHTPTRAHRPGPGGGYGPSVEPPRPDPSAPDLAGLIPALGDDRPSWLPEPVRGAARTVLLVLDGLGHLAFTAASEQDQPLLLALVTLGALATLLAFAFADWLHARLDRRAGAA